MTDTFTVRTGSAPIFGVRSGSGPALVLLHAGVADHRMWRDQVTALQDRCQVIAYDHLSDLS